jgi:hypothetical protein
MKHTEVNVQMRTLVRPKLIEVSSNDIRPHPAYDLDILKTFILSLPNRTRLTDEAVGMLSLQARLNLVPCTQELGKYWIVSGVRDFQVLRARSPSQKYCAVLQEGLDDATVQRWVKFDCYISLLTDRLDSHAVHFLAGWFMDNRELRALLNSMLPLQGNDNLSQALGISTNSMLENRKKRKSMPKAIDQFTSEDVPHDNDSSKPHQQS